MARFYVTFGQKSPFRQGYVEIMVNRDDDHAKEVARTEAFNRIGNQWSMIYAHDEFAKARQKSISKGTELFPAGKLGETIVV